jgi:hypothetical protein
MVILALVFGSVIAFSQETEIKPDFSIHDTDIAIAEGVWQGLHAIDVATTIKGPALDHCYVEADPVTKRLIGERPSVAGVVGWGIGYSALHYVVSAELSEHDAPKWVQWAWQAFNIEDTGRAVVNNFRIGIRFGGPNSHPGLVGNKLGCYRAG